MYELHALVKVRDVATSSGWRGNFPLSLVRNRPQAQHLPALRVSLVGLVHIKDEASIGTRERSRNQFMAVSGCCNCENSDRVLHRWAVVLLTSRGEQPDIRELVCFGVRGAAVVCR